MVRLKSQIEHFILRVAYHIRLEVLLRDREDDCSLAGCHLLVTVLQVGPSDFKREEDLEIAGEVVKSEPEGLIKLANVQLDCFSGIAPQIILA